MTDKEQNKSEVEQAPTLKDGSTGMNLRGKDRRRFIKRAIIAAPFILTVTSRPVWASNCTLSGQLSGNLSDANPPCEGQGCSPGYWKNCSTNMWHYEFPPGRQFEDVFGVDAFPGSTLGQVIAMAEGGSDVDMKPACHSTNNNNNSNYYNMLRQLGFHSVAALENAATAVSFDLTVDQVKTIFVDAYGSCDDSYMEGAKKDLDILNNQGCPF